MRLITKHLEAPALDPTVERQTALLAWLNLHIENAVSARNMQDTVWRESLRGYDAVPRQPVRNVPIENAPNIEVPLGAIATDVVYAQIIDLIFNIQPLLTVRPVGADKDVTARRRVEAEALQEHVNWGVANEWNVRGAAEESILDDVKLGTGVYYIPFVEDVRKTRAMTVTQRGPRVRTLPVEDFFVPGGSYGDLQEARWVAHREWLSITELEDRAAEDSWDISRVQSVGAIGWVRSRREMLGRTWRATIWGDIYEIWHIRCYFDIDDDGMAEDLLVTWDRTSRTLLQLRYNNYDRRPYEAMRYQLRGHLFYGIGVMDMTSMLQQEASDVHSYALTNALLANSRFWKARDGSLPDTMHVWPGKVQQMADPGDLVAEQMSDIFPSMIMMQQFPMSLAEKRVGLNDLSAPRGMNLASSRTPGITAISLLNQQNKRFTPAFDGVRLATAAAVRQCLFRESERLLEGDRELEAHLVKVHGEDKGNLIIGVLKDSQFDDAYSIELTASSTTMNRDVERQNAIMLVNFLGQYYQRVLELVAVAANPQTPGPVRDAAKKIADAAGAIVVRTLTTFDQIRDPSTFVVDINEELNQAADVGQQGMTMLMQFLGSVLPGTTNGAPALGPATTG